MALERLAFFISTFSIWVFPLKLLQYIWECSCVYFKYSHLLNYRFRLDLIITQLSISSWDLFHLYGSLSCYMANLQPLVNSTFAKHSSIKFYTVGFESLWPHWKSKIHVSLSTAVITLEGRHHKYKLIYIVCFYIPVIIIIYFFYFKLILFCWWYNP